MTTIRTAVAEDLASVLAIARDAGLVAVLTFTDAKDQHRMQRFFEDRGFRGWGIQLFRRR